ncbi:MAG: hypothetical protein K0S45_170 [Nitrospira sp.]|jgi:hypothetical protein|nr:hypothetical protein [Nitrospira sp.]
MHASNSRLSGDAQRWGAEMKREVALRQELPLILLNHRFDAGL